MDPSHCLWYLSINSSSGTRNFIERVESGGARNMKYKPPHMLVIFFMTTFYGGGGGGGHGPLAPMDPLLKYIICLHSSLVQTACHLHQLRCMRPFFKWVLHPFCCVHLEQKKKINACTHQAHSSLNETLIALASGGSRGGGGQRGHAPPPWPVKNRPKKMATTCSGLYFMFLGPPFRSFWIRYC